jgi:hypothetical protein
MVWKEINLINLKFPLTPDNYIDHFKKYQHIICISRWMKMLIYFKFIKETWGFVVGNYKINLAQNWYDGSLWGLEQENGRAQRQFN